MSHRIAVLIPWFGPWPAWIDFFMESCRANRTIDWFFFTDAEPPANRPPNVKFIRRSFEDYRDELSIKLGTKVAADVPYKLCDIRPALPYVHGELVNGYDFVGFGDIDVIYGDIRAFYDSSTLDRYDLLSSHRDRVSGHFCLVRNTPEMTTLFRDARGWKEAVGRTEYSNFDERGLYNHLRGKRGRFLPPRPLSHRCLFREAYSTPGATDRMRWYWKDGRLTNEFYPRHAFMYLHFMSWHSNRWYGDQPGADPNAPAPWSLLPDMVQIDWRDARERGFMISPNGIQPIEPPHYP
ncbi:MAG TPA: DUF6625 family protein [Sphingomicrobium sp.]|jgi:hypothetical protein|nr:DUF6625 family protein [Sphingomicrobium sp.]